MPLSVQKTAFLFVSFLLAYLHSLMFSQQAGIIYVIFKGFVWLVEPREYVLLYLLSLLFIDC